MMQKNSISYLEQHGIKSIPVGWTQSRVRYLGSYINGFAFKPEDWGATGRPILRIQNLSSPEQEPNRYEGELSNRYLVKYGDILISWSASLGVYRWKGEESWLNQHIFKVVLNQEKVRDDFFLWLAEWFIIEMDREVHGSTMQHLTADALGSFPLLLPPHSEQMKIADYLDRETERLDGLVAAKERLLELLDEKRKVLITRAVTHGLDLNVPLRDSGFPWIGKIPNHWKVERLKFHLNNIQQGWSPQCDNIPAEVDEWGVLKAGCVNGWEFDPNENKRLPEDLDPLTEYEVRLGDVLMSRANTTYLLGSTALVRNVRPRLLLCDKLYRLDVNESRLLKEFLVIFLRSPTGRYEFERDATGASNSMQNIGQDSVQNVWLTVPPVNEQHAIVSHIVIETAKLDELRLATEKTITLLKERRAALVTAAVTGKIKVR